MDELDLAMICVGIISCLASLSVVLTYLVFEDVRRRLFVQFIFFISLSDFFLNLSSSFGFPSNPQLCYAQGVLSTVFAMSSWLWTTALSYTMYMLIVRGKLQCNIYFGHLLCWGAPLITALLPLIWGEYSTPSPTDQWCIYRTNGHDKKFHTALTYLLHWVWLFSCVGLMLYWGVRVEFIMRQRDNKTSAVIRKCYSKIVMYPVVIGVCWSLRFIVREFGTKSNLLAFFGMLIGTLNGFFAAIIFFVKNPEVRNRWMVFICSGVSKNDPNEQFLTNALTGQPNQSSQLDDDIDIYDVARYDSGSFGESRNICVASAVKHPTENVRPSTSQSVVTSFERHSEF